MVRVLTNHQSTIDNLLTSGAFIYKRRYRVEPSRTTPPLPLRCEHCQSYNVHPTNKCPNTPTCGYCSGKHKTKDCTNLQNPPKCANCDEPHPSFSYKCKGRPTIEPDKPAYIAYLRLPEEPTPPQLIQQPITIEQLLRFLTITLQNLFPFDRENALREIQYAAQEIFKLTLHATYSGPYVHFSIPHPNTG